MIRRIKSDEYLKGYAAMNEEERKDYRKRVGEWLGDGGKRLMEMTDRPMAKAQNIVQLSIRWKEPEVRMFAEGARLLSALTGVADTWLPSQLYAKSAYRAVRQMVEVIKTCPLQTGVTKETNSKNAKSLDITEKQKQRIVERYVEKVSERKNGKKSNGTRTQQRNIKTENGGLAPIRPRHIDQYVHLLPEKTQERAAQYGPLMRDMGAARESLRLLMDDPSASAKSREQWAKVITRIDGRVKAIRDELDAEWTKLVEQGRVGVDDLGNAYVKEESTAETAELTSEQRTRRRELRKLLVDTRRGNGDKREEHLKKWNEKFKEYLTLEPKEKALADQKILNAAEHYGIDINAIS